MRLPALALAATLLVTSGCAADPEQPSTHEKHRAVDHSAPAGEQDPDQPASGPVDTGSAPLRDSFTAAVYYVGDTDLAGARLYREFRRLSGDDLLTAAVNAALGSDDTGAQLAPLDPDYRTLWPALTVAEARLDREGAVQIDLGGDPEPDLRERAPGMTSDEAELAVQQVVYTAQGAVQDRAPVRFLIRGEPTDRVLGVPTSRPVRERSPLQVLSHASLTGPEQGATVTDDTLEVSGVGNGFEANLGWEVRKGDRVVRDGFATMEGWMADRLFPFQTTVDISSLEPGTYSLWVTTEDPTGGSEGVGAMTDDKDFTIR